MPRSRACFASAVCCSDDFLDMSPSLQAFYFQLGFVCDNDGAVDGIMRFARSLSIKKDQLEELYERGYLLNIEGVTFIRDYNVNNKTDRVNYREGGHIDVVKRHLVREAGKPYRLKSDESLPSVANTIQNNSISKQSQNEENENRSEGAGSALPPNLAAGTCPSCGEPAIVTEAGIVQRIECMHCKRTFIVDTELGTFEEEQR